jgi:hypothetical protein
MARNGEWQRTAAPVVVHVYIVRRERVIFCNAPGRRGRGRRRSTCNHYALPDGNSRQGRRALRLSTDAPLLPGLRMRGGSRHWRRRPARLEPLDESELAGAGRRVPSGRSTAQGTFHFPKGDKSVHIEWGLGIDLMISSFTADMNRFQTVGAS